MTNSKSTKRALVSSALAVFLCVAMLIGTTFAWFTDTASTSVNKIQAGTLDVALEVKEGGNWVSAEGRTLDFVKAAGHESEAILWEPGCTYSLPELRIVNNGNLALKYKVVITGINGDAKLNEVIDWTIGTVAQGTEQKLAAGAKTEAFTISGTMKTTAGNEYQGLSIDGISITVYATQDTVEYDSNGNQYDKDATLPSFWDGRTETAPTKTDGVYHITNAAEFVYYIGNTNTGYDYVLDNDIDLSGYTITISDGDSRVFGSNFDGKNHTVSNFTLKGNRMYVSLFGYTSPDHADRTIKNLTVKNATVISTSENGQAAVILAAANTANNTYTVTVDNCKVYDSTVIGNKKVATVVGYTEGGMITNCYAENCNVYCADTRVDQAGEVVGYINTSAGLTDNTSNNTWENVNVFLGTSVTAVSTAAELKSALTSHGQNSDLGTIILVNDITVSDWNAISANYTSFVLDGNGHKIYGLTDALINAVGPNCDVVIKNLTLANVAISLDQATGGANASTGAFLREVNCEGGNTNLTIDNCHVDGGSVYSYKYAGGFTGMIGGNDTNNIVIKNSSIKNLAVSTTDSSAGGFVAHTHSKLTITDCSVLGTTSVKCAEDRNGSAAKAGYLVGTVNNRTTTISGCTVESTATLGNINAAAALNNGLVGRNYGTLNVAD